MVNKLMRFCCHFWLSLCDARLMNTLNGVFPTQCVVCEDLRQRYLSSSLSLSPPHCTPSLSPATLYTHFVTFWHIFVACHSRHSPQSAVRIVQANRHIWWQLERRRRETTTLLLSTTASLPPRSMEYPLPIGLARYGGANEKSPGIFWGTHVFDVSR